MDKLSTPQNKFDDLGKHFIVSLPTSAVTEQDKRLLSSLQPAGILLRQQSFLQDKPYSEWLSALSILIEEAKQYAAREKFIVAIDHEGGRVYRTPPPITKFCYAISFAHKAKEVGAAMGLELASLGVNLYLGPVADIHLNPNNPVIGPRAFGTTAKAVCDAVIQFAEAIKAAGLAFCPKHFPGHGDTAQDSHLELPRLDIDGDTLLKRELLPFKALITSGAQFIMTSHILFPKIDDRFPATMSRALIHTILRNDCKYNGVVISDDLDMRAISDNFSVQDVARNALNAGCDMFIFNHHPRRALELAEAIRCGIQNGDIQQETVAAATTRIDNALNSAIKSYSTTLLSQPILQRHQQLAMSLPEKEEYKGMGSYNFEPR